MNPILFTTIALFAVALPCSSLERRNINYGMYAFQTNMGRSRRRNTQRRKS
ncbi:hypothetical protein DSO57_1011775 [Entomophthora muscae]|uniref:Uncharacterized protein n=2 Tax=Entomophthora muscae TaxID=34485 RepID=A0ACC2SAL1_9FUNG|nr:hypothetical protein DSO57_1003513 [Entomophthora muscae]KAJ9073884.1 hypothetical protein DSO57_1011775 [Entomophthora muscae]